jgi:hypothetical protein
MIFFDMLRGVEKVHHPAIAGRKLIGLKRLCCNKLLFKLI